jgi:hypothetical protein
MQCEQMPAHTHLVQPRACGSCDILVPKSVGGIPHKIPWHSFLVAKLPWLALQPLVDRVTDRLPSLKGWLLHHSGCLMLIKTTLSTILIYTSINIGLPSWMHKVLNKIMTLECWTSACSALCFALASYGCNGWIRQRPWASMNIIEGKHTTALFNASVCFVLGNGETFLF